MYKLIKLKEGYIIVSWEEQLIKENQYYLGYPSNNTVHQRKMGTGIHKGKSAWCKIVIASNFIPELPNIDFNNLEEEFDIVDVEKLKNSWYNTQEEDRSEAFVFQYSGVVDDALEAGIKIGLELNKDKLYTLEDILQLFDGDYIYTIKNRAELSEYIKKKLNKPNEWDIEIEHTCKGVKRKGESCTLNNKCTYPNCGEIKINKI